jgi:hypothetical protein
MRWLALLPVLAVLAAGCGGGGGSSASNDDIANAATKTAKAGSLEAEFAISGQGIKGDGSGVFNTGKDSSGQLQMTVTSSGRQVPVDTIVTGQVFYMRSPALSNTLSGGKQWIKVDLNELAKQRGVNLGSLFDASPTPMNALAYLAGSSKVEKVGAESVGGTDTTHYRVTVDVKQAAKKASGAARRSIRSVLTQGGVSKLPLDVWVDGNNYIRKVIYDEQAPGQSPTKVTMQLHDFGKPISIQAPPSQAVVDLLQLQAGGGQ